MCIGLMDGGCTNVCRRLVEDGMFWVVKRVMRGMTKILICFGQRVLGIVYCWRWTDVEREIRG